jgi:hypothetical protein
MHKDIDQGRFGDAYEIGVNPFLIDFHLVKIEPDALIFGAAVVAADARALVIYAAIPRVTIEMAAITVTVMANEIGPAQIPFDFSLLQLSDAKGEVEFAAC